jgi:hypothetical protein
LDPEPSHAELEGLGGVVEEAEEEPAGVHLDLGDDVVALLLGYRGSHAELQSYKSERTACQSGLPDFSLLNKPKQGNIPTPNCH